MIGEFLGGSCLILMLIRLYFHHSKPEHIEFKTKYGEHTHYDTFENAFNAMKRNLVVFSEPFVKIFGIPILHNYQINDAELVRKFFMTEKAQSHLEMSGFFELAFQYRQVETLSKKSAIFEAETTIIQ